MDRRVFLKRSFLVSCLPAVGGVIDAAGMGAKGGSKGVGRGKPHIVFILADDLGYGDVGYFNQRSKIPTPNLDALAKGGMVFKDAHSGSAVCTPTRYGVMTGRYCWRSRLKRGVLGGFSTHLIEDGRMTVASMLKTSGYHTACIGKWHLGMDFPKGSDKKTDYSGKITHGPTAKGFDYYYGVSASLDMPPYVFIENDRFSEPVTRKYPGTGFPGYSRAGDMGEKFSHIKALDQLTAKSAAYIKERAKGDKPFFLYFPLTSPHKPVMPAERFQGKSGIGPYGDFVMQTDWVVGQVDKALTDAGIADDTLVILSSDNGSFMYRYAETDADDHVSKPSMQGYKASNHTANYIFRGTKADVWEAGHRVPFIVRWPGKVRKGSYCGKTICLTDIMATCADVVGAELPDNAAEDSFSILPLIVGKDKQFSRGGVVNHSANGVFALRQGKWKLVFGNGSGGREKPAGKPWSKPYHLYDMAEDMRETKNLIDDKDCQIWVRHMEALMKQYIDQGRSREVPKSH